MIVDPDFLDHWRTRMVVDALGDESAPLCILRLWGHCQTRKSWRFEMPVKGLKSQCRFAGDAEVFEAALVDAGFLKREGEFIEVVGWEEKNKSLIAAWDNGNKGGRPPKKPNQNPRVTDKEPTGNPAVTQQKPSANPRETDKRREEKSYSVPDGTDGAAVSADLTKAELWEAGKSLLAEQGLPKAQCGSFVGKLVKDFGDAIVIEAVRATVVARPADAAEYLKAICLRSAGQRGPPEPTWRAEQRTRTQQAAPGVAARGVPADKFFIDVEASNVTPLRLG